MSELNEQLGLVIQILFKVVLIAFIVGALTIAAIIFFSELFDSIKAKRIKAKNELVRQKNTERIQQVAQDILRETEEKKRNV